LIKKSNDSVKLQALINMKKVIITEDTIRQPLRVDDADGQSYLGIRNCQAQAESQEVREEEENQEFRVKRLRKEGGIDKLDADEDVTLVDVDAKVEMDVNIQGRMAESQAKDEAFARQLKAELNANINWNEVIEQARKNMMIYLKNMAGFKMNFFKEKEVEEVTVQEKRQGKNLEQETSKKQRIDEDAKELKRHLHIVVNDDDYVYTKATPLASKALPLPDHSNHIHQEHHMTPKLWKQMFPHVQSFLCFPCAYCLDFLELFTP
nr:hypothetical protein [Tanacetum cinerariifolium]